MTVPDENDPDAMYSAAMELIDEDACRLTDGQWDGDAYRYLLRAAILGHPDAQFRLAQFYSAEADRRFTEDITDTAIEWFEKAAEGGNTRAMLRMSAIWNDDIFLGEKDDKKSADYFRRALESDPSDAVAQYEIGVAYAKGEIVEKDMARALEWFRKAAEQGDREAEYSVGLCYLDGLGTGRSLEDAERWMLRAAEHGDVNAMMHMGARYLADSYRKAADWFGRAAEQGNFMAMIELGIIYDEDRLGLPDTRERAKEWFERAAETEGSTVILEFLADLYENGEIDVPDSYERAVYWYTRAAAMDSSKAIARLSKMRALKDR